MNAQKLFRLNAQNRAAQIFFAAYATRRRALTQTTVADVVDLARRDNIILPPSDVEAFFNGLEDADCGQFVHDEDGDRFVWIARSNEVSRAARKVSDAPSILSEPAPESQNVTHTLRLRPDWTLQLELPPDFSPLEAKRLCHFVLSLPLEADKPAMQAAIPSMQDFIA